MIGELRRHRPKEHSLCVTSAAAVGEGKEKLAQEFDLEIVLTVTTNTVVTPDGLDAIHKFVEFVCGRPVHSHQLNRGLKACRAHILRMHPQLGDVDTSSVNKKTWPKWIDAQKQRFGAVPSIEQLPDNTGIVGDVLSDAEEKFPGRVIAVRQD